MNLLELPNEMIETIFSFISNPSAFFVNKTFKHYMETSSLYQSIIPPTRIVYNSNKIVDDEVSSYVQTDLMTNDLSLKLDIYCNKDEHEHIEIYRKLKIYQGNIDQCIYPKVLIDCDLYLFVENELMPYHFKYRKECTFEKMIFKNNQHIAKYVLNVDTIGYISDFDFTLKKVVVKYNKIIRFTKEMIEEFHRIFE
jgi:hypothetical protein